MWLGLLYVFTFMPTNLFFCITGSYFYMERRQPSPQSMETYTSWDFLAGFCLVGLPSQGRTRCNSQDFNDYSKYWVPINNVYPEKSGC